MTKLDMYLQGMKDMYEWVQLMTKDRLSPTSMPSYVIPMLNNSKHSSLTEVRSDRIGRSITPRPQSCYYSSPHGTPYQGTSLNTAPGHSRPLSAMSDDLYSCLNYSRSSTSPGRDQTSCASYSHSPSNRQVSTPLLLDKRSNFTVKDRGVFGILYCLDCTKRKTANQTYKNPYRHSSFSPEVTKDSVNTELNIIDESPKNELKQFDEALANYREGKSAANKTIETEKYFDNLVALIEEAAMGLS